MTNSVALYSDRPLSHAVMLVRRNKRNKGRFLLRNDTATPLAGIWINVFKMLSLFVDVPSLYSPAFAASLFSPIFPSPDLATACSAEPFGSFQNTGPPPICSGSGPDILVFSPSARLILFRQTPDTPVQAPLFSLAGVSPHFWFPQSFNPIPAPFIQISQTWLFKATFCLPSYLPRYRWILPNAVSVTLLHSV